MTDAAAAEDEWPKTMRRLDMRRGRRRTRQGPPSTWTKYPRRRRGPALSPDAVLVRACSTRRSLSPADYKLAEYVVARDGRGPGARARGHPPRGGGWERQEEEEVDGVDQAEPRGAGEDRGVDPDGGG